MTQEPNHDLKGIVIVRDGHLVSEHYFNGDSAISLHDIRSAKKSVTSLLMGIAIQKGLVHSVDDAISLYLPGLPKDRKEKITIKDLLNSALIYGLRLSSPLRYRGRCPTYQDSARRFASQAQAIARVIST